MSPLDRDDLLMGQGKQPFGEFLARQVADLGERAVRGIVPGNRAGREQPGYPIEIGPGSVGDIIHVRAGRLLFSGTRV